MNDIQIFNNPDFGEIRTEVVNGVVWFIAADICRILEIKNNRDALSKLDEDEKGVVLTDTPGGIQQIKAVNEFGLYSLISHSRKPEAKKFQRWVNHEVLPSIRKNGGYIARQETLTPEQIVANALIVAQNIISDRDKQIAEMKPKADFFDAVADSKTAISMNEVAKVLAIKGYGRNNLFEFLRNVGILDRYNVPYQKYVDAGWFRVIEQKYVKNGEPYVTTKTLVYQKGVDAIRRKLSAEVAV